MLCIRHIEVTFAVVHLSVEAAEDQSRLLLVMRLNDQYTSAFVPAGEADDLQSIIKLSHGISDESSAEYTAAKRQQLESSMKSSHADVSSCHKVGAGVGLGLQHLWVCIGLLRYQRGLSIKMLCGRCVGCLKSVVSILCPLEYQAIIAHSQKWRLKSLMSMCCPRCRRLAHPPTLLPHHSHPHSCPITLTHTPAPPLSPTLLPHHSHPHSLTLTGQGTAA
jgi:hypothetical protein